MLWSCARAGCAHLLPGWTTSSWGFIGPIFVGTESWRIAKKKMGTVGCVLRCSKAQGRMPPSLEAKLATRDFPPVARRCLEATRSLFLRVAFFSKLRSGNEVRGRSVKG